MKRSKKEIESAWDKERKELGEHIANLEAFIKELQAQLLTRTATTLGGTSAIGGSGVGMAASAGGGGGGGVGASHSDSFDQFGQNERIQSLSGENDFLKNRIREVRSDSPLHSTISSEHK